MVQAKKRRSGWRAALPWFLLAAALGLWTLGGGHGGPTLPPGRAAPELRLPATGGEFDLSAHRGRVVVLAFWATWCPACRAEAPALSRLHSEIEASGDIVLGVSVDTEPLEEIERAARGLGMTYPIARAERADLDRFQVQLLPTIYVIDPDGQVVESFTGGVGATRLREAVQSAHDSRLSAR